MTDTTYVKQYFSQHAAGWLAGAYSERTLPQKYPVGVHRVRLAIEAIVERLGSSPLKVADLGCGGGDLCVHAAHLGMAATGIDIADGMIAEARRKLPGLPADVRRRVDFILGNVLDNQLPSSSYDAVTALGLIEYLPEDGPLLSTADRLLKPGGVLVVSCRNRLFNMASFNEYTAREIERGSAGELLAEIATRAAGGALPAVMAEFVRKLESAAPRLKEAIARDLESGETRDGGLVGAPGFAQPRRQHTPDELSQAAQAAGFTKPSFFGVHPHPFPPGMEAATPRLYNQLASVFEVFERSSVSLVWSSAFLGVFSKPDRPRDGR